MHKHTHTHINWPSKMSTRWVKWGFSQPCNDFTPKHNTIISAWQCVIEQGTKLNSHPDIWPPIINLANVQVQIIKHSIKYIYINIDIINIWRRCTGLQVRTMTKKQHSCGIPATLTACRSVLEQDTEPQTYHQWMNVWMQSASSCRQTGKAL